MEKITEKEDVFVYAVKSARKESGLDANVEIRNGGFFNDLDLDLSEVEKEEFTKLYEYYFVKALIQYFRYKSTYYKDGSKNDLLSNSTSNHLMPFDRWVCKYLWESSNEIDYDQCQDEEMTSEEYYENEMDMLSGVHLEEYAPGIIEYIEQNTQEVWEML